MGRPKKEIMMTLPTGEVSRMYSFGMIAAELGRRPKTIRSWYDKQYILDSGFRDKEGHILYSEEQKNIIVTAAKNHGSDYLKASRIACGKLFKRKEFCIECQVKLKEVHKKYALAYKKSIDKNKD